MPSRELSVSWPDSVLAGLLAAMALLAWCALGVWGNSAYGHVLLHGHVHMIGGSHRVALLAAVFVAGWVLMTVAMMLPTSIPLVVLFYRMVRDRRFAAWLVGAVLAGYVATWVLCGVLLQLGNLALQAGLARVWLPAAAPWIGAAVLLAIAGLYQFSPLKYACLDKCRSPLSFLASRWQGGNESAQAFRIGVEHGLFCVGCCWSLMLLMFLVGTGGVAWMLLLGVVMAIEKNHPLGRRLSVPLGWLMLVASAAMAVRATL